MALPNVVEQVWRLVRVGGVAALAATQAASRVATTTHKDLVIVGAVAGVEAIYRALVPAKDVSALDRSWAAVKAVLADPVVATEVKAIEGKVPAPVLSAAEQAIADAGHVQPDAGPGKPS